MSGAGNGTAVAARGTGLRSRGCRARLAHSSDVPTPGRQRSGSGGEPAAPPGCLSPVPDRRRRLAAAVSGPPSRTQLAAVSFGLSLGQVRDSPIRDVSAFDGALFGRGRSPAISSIAAPCGARVSIASGGLGSRRRRPCERHPEGAAGAARRACLHPARKPQESVAGGRNAATARPAGRCSADLRAGRGHATASLSAAEDGRAGVRRCSRLHPVTTGAAGAVAARPQVAADWQVPFAPVSCPVNCSRLYELFCTRFFIPVITPLSARFRFAREVAPDRRISTQ